MVLPDLFKYYILTVFAPGKLLRRKYEAFRELLRHDKRSLELITDLEDILRGTALVDWERVESLVSALRRSTGSLIRSLAAMHPNGYRDLEERFHELDSALVKAVASPVGASGQPNALTPGETGRAPEAARGKTSTPSLLLQETGPSKTAAVRRPDGEAEPEPMGIANPVLLEGGVTASPGVGTGRVCLVKGEEDLANVPEGAVLVSPALTPAFAAVIRRLRAAVADHGSMAIHFAVVAREYGLPVIAGARDATKLLPPGRVVTVDAGQCRVFLGEMESLKSRQTPTSAGDPATSSLARLRSLMEFVSPLHLTDPSSPAFSPRDCRSLHDLVRFSHEKGMLEMFSLASRHGRGLGRARRLDTDLPLVMYVLDLGGGISPEAGPGKTVSPRHIVSEPMRACWQGLTHPEVIWRKGLLHIDWEALDRVSSGLMSLRSPALASYAIISRDYNHLILRFGYHFAIIDTLSGTDPEANYITFRFKGGGGSFENRLRRIQLIRTILEWAGFAVHTRGDLLDASFRRREARPILSRLTLMGLLQGKTMLLDMSLNSHEQVIRQAEDFMHRYNEYVADEPD